jgi:hypothetical protein
MTLEETIHLTGQARGRNGWFAMDHLTLRDLDFGTIELLVESKRSPENCSPIVMQLSPEGLVDLADLLHRLIVQRAYDGMAAQRNGGGS